MTWRIVVVCSFLCVSAVGSLYGETTPIASLSRRVDGKSVTVEGTVVEIKYEPGKRWINFDVCDGTGRVHVYWKRETTVRPDWFREGVEVRVSGDYNSSKKQIEVTKPEQQVTQALARPYPRYTDMRVTEDWAITFYGAAGEVAGSCYLVSGPTARVLVDCGSFMGSEVEGSGQASSTRYDPAPFAFDPKSVRAVLITHAHDDHTGRLQYLFDQGFGGKVYMTPPSAELYRVKLVTEDALKYSCILESERPTLRDTILDSIESRFTNYWFPVAPGVQAMFVNAGHIPGSVSVALRLQQGDAWVTVTFSGDIGSGTHPFLNPPDLGALSTTGTEVLVLESTYGKSQGSSASVTMADFYGAIVEAKSSDKLVIIPAFALDRTQRVLAALADGKASGALPASLRIGVADRSAESFTTAYIGMQNREAFGYWFSQEFISRRPLSGAWGYRNFSDPEVLTVLKDRAQRQFDVVVAPSGNGTTSDAKVLLQAFLEDKDALIIKVGWAPEWTPMGQLREVQPGLQRIEVDGKQLTRNAAFRDFSALFSGHANQAMLLLYIEAFPNLRTVILTHGEDSQRGDLANAILERFPNLEGKVIRPGYGETVKVVTP